MPELGVEGLVTEADRNRAMLLLSYLGHAYVFADENPADVVPAQLARPWCAVAAMLGRPPVLSYASHALSNWRRFDPMQPIGLGNIARLENFLGGVDEDWFVLVHVAIEASAGPGVAAAVSAQDAVQSNDVEQVERELVTIGDTLETMLAILRKMPDQCDPYIYYNRVRQFIFGWMDNPGLPDGVVYEGVEAFGGKPQKFRGETGAQSSIIPALDTVLGVDLSGDRLGQHLLELRDYMPTSHREFLDLLAKRPSVRDFVLANADDEGLAGAYNRCVELIAQFRMQHLEYAGTYIRGQQQRSSANPVEVGTGGTPFMKYLSQHVHDMNEYLVKSAS
jgi:indoleamine 2,3-dioxygenase